MLLCDVFDSLTDYGFGYLIIFFEIVDCDIVYLMSVKLGGNFYLSRNRCGNARDCNMIGVYAVFPYTAYKNPRFLLRLSLSMRAKKRK